MSQVVIGMDPHKRTATIEVMAGDEAMTCSTTAGYLSHRTWTCGSGPCNASSEGHCVAHQSEPDRLALWVPRSN